MVTGKAGDEVASAEVQERARREIDLRGVKGACQLFGVSRESLLRLASGAPVRRGTLSLVERTLEALKRTAQR